MNDPNLSPATNHTRPRVLLVEDNSAASRGLARLLEAQGYDVCAVCDGASALAALRESPAPDFLLTDLQLPDHDGFEIARQASQLDRPPRVALISGWDVEHLNRESRRLGIEWVFPKPLNVQELFEKLREPCPSRGEGPQPG